MHSPTHLLSSHFDRRSRSHSHSLSKTCMKSHLVGYSIPRCALITLVCLLSDPNVFACGASLIHSLPVSHCPHLLSGRVASRPKFATCCCFEPSLPYLRFHYALGCHRPRHSQELRNTYTSVRNLPLFFPILSSPLTLLGVVLVLDLPQV